jgi:hypothetical protein
MAVIYPREFPAEHYPEGQAQTIAAPISLYYLDSCPGQKAANRPSSQRWGESLRNTAYPVPHLRACGTLM